MRPHSQEADSKDIKKNWLNETMYIQIFTISIALCLLGGSVLGFNPSSTSSMLNSIHRQTLSTTSSNTVLHAHWMEFLKYDKDPKFDVIEKTKEFNSQMTHEDVAPYFADDYVFRGPVIGPITANDVAEAQKGFNVQNAYPNLKREVFGHTIDPENPYKCLFFERWSGVNSESIKLGPMSLPATGEIVELPTHVSSVHWNPEGKITYLALSPPLDRFEGNTKGVGAVLGLLVGAGVNQGNAQVGDGIFIAKQNFVQSLKFLGKQWSNEDDIPSWWKSKARGAGETDL